MSYQETVMTAPEKIVSMYVLSYFTGAQLCSLPGSSVHPSVGEVSNRGGRGGSKDPREGDRLSQTLGERMFCSGLPSGVPWPLLGFLSGCLEGQGRGNPEDMETAGLPTGC